MDARYRIFELASMLQRRYDEHPIQPDLFGDYEALQVWSYLNDAFPIVEMALKLLSDEVGTRSHDIGKLFSRFSEHSPTKAHKVEQAVREYAAFYRVDVKEHPEFSSASSFLEHVGDEYVNWRYWPLEDSTIKFTWPSLLVEIATSLGAVLLDQQPSTVYDRIMYYLGDAATYPTRWLDVLETFEVDGRALILELEDWQSSKGGLQSAFESYVTEGLDIQWSKALECLLYGAYRHMLTIETQAVRDLMAMLTNNGQTGPLYSDSHGGRRLRPESSRSVPRLVKIEARDPYLLWVEFDDGTSGLADLSPEDGDIPPPWQTPEGWADVAIEDHVPVWNGWYDACPNGIWHQLTA